MCHLGLRARRWTAVSPALKAEGAKQRQRLAPHHERPLFEPSTTEVDILPVIVVEAVDTAAGVMSYTMWKTPPTGFLHCQDLPTRTPRPSDARTPLDRYSG